MSRRTFFTLVVRCHVIAEFLGMESVSNVPLHHGLKDDLSLEDKDTRYDTLQSIVNEIVLHYVDIEPHFCDYQDEKT